MNRIADSRLMPSDARIYVAGHSGMVGSAIVRKLRDAGYHELILTSSAELDLTQQEEVRRFLREQAPDYVFLAAAKVGGIHANSTYPADFIYQNMMIEANVIHACWQTGVRDLLFLGSSCIYPRDCEQPIREEYILSGALEETNAPYAIAKIAGVKLCEAFNTQYGTRYVSLMSTNLYGPNDNYDLSNGHVLPALLRKAHEAKINQATELVVWGSGTPRREFMYVDDLATACVFTMQSRIGAGRFNVGTGEDITIRELSERIAAVVGYEGRIVFDTSKPDGTPRKLLNIERMRALGWAAHISLNEGLALTYADFLANPPCNT